MEELKDLKIIAEFLIEHETEFSADEMFGVIFPVVCIKLNKTNNIGELFKIFLDWWNENSEFRVISIDLDVANKFIEYFYETK